MYRYTDIDECDEHLSGCNQLCTNTIGGHYCTCFAGFLLASNNRTCQGIEYCSNVPL